MRGGRRDPRSGLKKSRIGMNDFHEWLGDGFGIDWESLVGEGSTGDTNEQNTAARHSIISSFWMTDVHFCRPHQHLLTRMWYAISVCNALVRLS